MNAAVAQERWQGQIVDGKFPLLEWLGGSANTAVFRTELPNLAQPAAIKLVRAESATAAQQISRWKESAALSHSNLLKIFEAGNCQITGARWLYVVMEYAEENLDQVLPVRSLSSIEVGELLPPVLEALSFLHAKGLVHGKIKPSNILAIKNQLKLSTDSVQPASQNISAHAVSAYDAPEVSSGTLSEASDVWSLGMTLVSAFNQRPLSWSRAGHRDPAVPKSVPAPYSLIASECLRINPGERCSVARIRELMRQQPTLVQPAPERVPAKRRNLIPLLAGIVIAAIIFGVVLHYSTKKVVQNAASPEAPATSVASQPQSANNSTAGTSAVSSPSAVVSRVLPQVPLSARETIQGKVRVKVQVTVDRSGDVSSATLSSAGPSRYFARLALEASKQWKFKPAEEDGAPAAARWLLEYKFGRTSTEVEPVELH